MQRGGNCYFTFKNEYMKILAVLHRCTPDVRVGIEKHKTKLARGGGGGTAGGGSRPGSRAAMKESPPLVKLLNSYDKVHRAKCIHIGQFKILRVRLA